MDPEAAPDIVKLRECPLCALDPRRNRYPLGTGSPLTTHLQDDHAPDDIGRPIEELLVKYQLGGVSDRGQASIIAKLALGAGLILLGLVGLWLNSSVSSLVMP